VGAEQIIAPTTIVLGIDFKLITQSVFDRYKKPLQNVTNID
jgi:hypothetical protein